MTMYPRPSNPLDIHEVDQAPYHPRLFEGGRSSTSSSTNSLPAFDKARGTRNVCFVGLAVSWVISITCIVLSPWTFKTGKIYLDQNGGYKHDGKGERIFFLKTREQDLVKLGLNICITLSTDCLG